MHALPFPTSRHERTYMKEATTSISVSVWGWRMYVRGKGASLCDRVRTSLPPSLPPSPLRPNIGGARWCLAGIQASRGVRQSVSQSASRLLSVRFVRGAMKRDSVSTRMWLGSFLSFFFFFFFFLINYPSRLLRGSDEGSVNKVRNCAPLLFFPFFFFCGERKKK
ncbi:hypothetical protein B0J12DRAFT_93938 [Macrophomina phaseolina]|uniref:Transmembrane protein n=1 Tax=Macrophomina phaseolina TaxID=35725 RepID=A0ABQ8GB36_9PEZI|nr:hypothetical protein B0J12DRAFT_93938 [Macrophomina phaseolina]